MSKTMLTNKQEVQRAVKALYAGGVIAFPTETVYGLGCDPRNRAAVHRVFRLKGRDPSKPLLLVASSFAQVRSVAVLKGQALLLAKRYWPGPLTLALPLKRPSLLVAGVAVKGEVSVRFSSSKTVQALTGRFGFPIVATSANPSGASESHSRKDVVSYFGERLDAIVDGGRLPIRKSSTVLRVREDECCEVIREWAIRLPKKDRQTLSL